MKKQCRPGDLAVILSSEDEFNGGLIVNVVELDDGRLGFNYAWSGPTWWVRSTAPLTWATVEHSGLITANEGPIPDAALLPIRGCTPEHGNIEEGALDELLA